MKILITGGGGYIGSVLTRLLLNQGYEVTVLDNGWRNIDNLVPLVDDLKFNFVHGSVGNVDLIIKLKETHDFVVHLASLVGEPICAKYPELATSVNEEGTYNLVECGRNLPILFASTGSVYGKLSQTCTEDIKINPISHYALTKACAEQYVKGSSDFIIYRFSTAFGISPNLRLDLLVNDLCYQAWKTKSITIFQADFKRTFIDVEDISLAILHGIRNFEQMKGQIYNVGSDEGNWSKRQLAEFIKKVTGCSVFYGDEGYFDIDVRDYFCSFEKIKATGWSAKVSMEDGISRLIRAFPTLKADLTYRAV